MRAIFSEVKRQQDKYVFSFEMLDNITDSKYMNIIFREQETNAIISFPINHSNGNIMSITLDPLVLKYPVEDVVSFNWHIYLAINDGHTSELVNVENNYITERILLDIKGSSFEFLTSSDGQAIISVKTEHIEEKFNVTSVNLSPEGLYISGVNHYNNCKMSNQKIILKKRHNRYENVFSIGTIDYIFDALIPIEEIEKKGTYDLYTSFDIVNSHNECINFYQRIEYKGAKQGLNMKFRVAKKENVELIIHADGTVFLQRYTVDPLPITAKKKIVGANTKFQNNKNQLMRKNKVFLCKRILNKTHEPFENQTVVFESFGGRQVSDSPMAIYKLMQRYYPSYQLIWSIDKVQVEYCVANGIEYIVRETQKWANTMAKAHIWVSNARIPLWVKKQTHTLYVQTWHGTPLKKLGLDIQNVSMPGTTTEKYHRNFVKEANRWDALISPNDYSTAIFRSAFGFDNKILKVGYPRNDKLINATAVDINDIKVNLGIPENKNVILYAPTYRDNQFIEQGKYTFELPFDLNDMKAKFGADSVLVLRMHYLISNALDLTGFEDFVINASDHPDISDLYLASDMLITDYSSVFFDYAYLKKPMLFYPYDYHVYKDELRGFYLDYEKTMPGAIVKNRKDLMLEIQNSLSNENVKYAHRFEDFYERYCAINDGKSSFKTVDFIVNNMKRG